MLWAPTTIIWRSPFALAEPPAIRRGLAIRERVFGPFRLAGHGSNRSPPAVTLLSMRVTPPEHRPAGRVRRVPLRPRVSSDNEAFVTTGEAPDLEEIWTPKAQAYGSGDPVQPRPGLGYERVYPIAGPVEGILTREVERTAAKRTLWLNLLPLALLIVMAVIALVTVLVARFL
jgi:hypothetical protein